MKKSFLLFAFVFLCGSAAFIGGCSTDQESLSLEEKLAKDKDFIALVEAQNKAKDNVDELRASITNEDRSIMLSAMSDWKNGNIDQSEALNILKSEGVDVDNLLRAFKLSDKVAEKYPALESTDIDAEKLAELLKKSGITPRGALNNIGFMACAINVLFASIKATFKAITGKGSLLTRIDPVIALLTPSGQKKLDYCNDNPKCIGKRMTLLGNTDCIGIEI